MLSKDKTPESGGAGFKVDPIGTGATVIRLELRQAGIDPSGFPPALFAELAEHCLKKARRIATATGRPAADTYAHALEDLARTVAATVGQTRPLC